MAAMNEQAEHYFEKVQKWSEETNALRDIVRTNESLEEDYKWMHPCYTFQGKNIVLIHSFKEYCALLFHKGSLLEDPQGLLIQQTEKDRQSDVKGKRVSVSVALGGRGIIREKRKNKYKNRQEQ